jgi:hypothetical protein
MSGLITVSDGLQNAVSLAEARASLEPYGFSDIPRVTIPRDIEKGWTWESLVGSVKAGQSLKGVYLGHTQPEHTLWPYTGGGSGAPPYLRSADGVIGIKTGDDHGDLDEKEIESAKNEDGTYRWQDISYCQWTERNGRRIPPRAKQSLRVYVLHESGEPVSISLPGTSIRYFRKFAGSPFSVPGSVAISLDLEEVKGTSNNYVVAKTVVAGKFDADVAAKFRDLYVSRVAPLLEPRSVSPSPSVAAKTLDVKSEAVPF